MEQDNKPFVEQVTKRYTLLKNLPQCNAGTTFEKYKEDAVDYMAVGIETWNSGLCKDRPFYLDDSVVENNPEWFEEVKQPLPSTPERIKVGKMSCSEGEQGYGEMKWNLQFKTNKHIHYDKSIDLCNLLERFLNGDMDNPNPFDGKRHSFYLSDEAGQWAKPSRKYSPEEINEALKYFQRQPLQFYSKEKTYTQSEVDTIREEAFNAARELSNNERVEKYSGTGLKHPTYKDYQQATDKKLRIGLDNICPITKKPCDDETCTPGAECNISGSKLSDAPQSCHKPPQWEIVSYEENDEKKTEWTIDRVVSDQWRSKFQDVEYWTKTSPTLTGTKFSIKSVLRKEDGVVFSCGDNLGDWFGEIKEIKIDSKYDGGMVFLNEDRGQCIATAKKSEPPTPSPLPVTERDLLNAEHAAFYAGRETYIKDCSQKNKYPTFSDYKNNKA